MGGLHVAAEDVLRVHGALGRDLAISHGRPDGDRAVMAAQTLIAGRPEHGLHACVLFGGAGVYGVGLGGELLVPEADVQSGMGRVTVIAGVGTGAGDGRFAARPEAVHAHHVACDLRMESGRGEQNRQSGYPDSEPHLPPPLAPSCSTGFFEATYWKTWTRRLNESTTYTRSLWSINKPAGSWNSPACVP